MIPLRKGILKVSSDMFLNLSPDLNSDEFGDPLTKLNITLAERNRIILEQEKKIHQLDSLVESLLGQVQSFRVLERKFKYELNQAHKSINKLIYED